MTSGIAQEQLLFAVIAVQLGFASPRQVMAAAAAWMADRSRDLVVRLEDEGVVSPSQREMIIGMLAEAVRVNGGNVGATLDAFGGAEVVEQTFAGSMVLEADGQVHPTEAQTNRTVGDGHEDQRATTPECSGRYEIRTEHGRGGQARVMLAFDRHVGREVAWKELVPERDATASNRENSSDRSRASAVRFLREARITGKLEHPNIVPVYEVGEQTDGQPYYTMRLVGGKTLARRLAACESLDDRMKLLGSVWDLSNAIAFAHSRGVIHRDIKPENVMVGEFGETVVLDWGLAKAKGKDDLHEDTIERQAEQLHQLEPGQTVAGSAMGTPSYMSPEQAEGRLDRIDERSDVWGLGAVLYELLTGRPPFVGETPFEIVGKVMRESVQPVAELCPEAPSDLAAVAEKALQHDRDGRYASARDLAEEISAYMTGSRVGAYEYTSWELFKRFASRNRTAVLATWAIFAVVIAALVQGWWAFREEAEARRLAVLATQREQAARLRASFNLARAFAREAERLVDGKRILSGRILAAASLNHNPASAEGVSHDPNFATGRPKSDLVRVWARSLLETTSLRLVQGLHRIRDRESPVTRVAFSPDGRHVAVADSQGLLLVKSVADDRDALQIELDSRLSALAWSSDGKRLATSDAKGNFGVWDFETGKRLLQERVASDVAVYDVAFAPDCQRLAVVDGKGFVEVWGLESRKRILRFSASKASVRAVSFSPDGRLMALSGDGRAIKLHDATTGSLVKTFLGHTAEVYSVAFSSDGSRLVSSSFDKTARIWNLRTDTGATVMRGHQDGVMQASFSHDDKMVVTAGADEVVGLWDSSNGDLLFALDAHKGMVHSVSLSPDGRWLASGGSDGALRLWRLNPTDGRSRFRHQGWVYGMDVDRDQKLMAVGLWEGPIELWDLDSQKRIRTLSDFDDNVLYVRFSPRGSLLVAGGINGTVGVWRVATGERIEGFRAHRMRTYGLAFSRDEKTLVTGSLDGDVHFWDCETGTRLRSLPKNESGVSQLAFSPDERLLAVASRDNLVRLIEPGGGRVVHTLRGHVDWVHAVAFSPDGRWLASTGKDGMAFLWDVASGQQLHRFAGHEQWVNDIRFSPDGRLVATGSDDRTAIVWEATSGRPVLRLRARAMVATLEFTDAGRSLALGDVEETILYSLNLDVPRPGPATLEAEAQVEAGLVRDGLDLSTQEFMREWKLLPGARK